VQSGPGNPADCVAIYPAGLPDVAEGSMLNYFYLNGSKTAPSTGLTSATVAFPMPTTAGPYEFRLWRNCAAILAESQVVTVGTSGGAFSFTVNGSTAALTVAAGATVPLGVQNGPGNPADCVAIYPPALPTRRSSDLLNYFYLNGSKTAPSTGLTSATVAFPMPTTAGPYEFRLWRNCAAILAESQVVTVGTSGGAFSFTVNGSTAALTVAAGATVPLGVQNGPGNPADCVAIYPPALPTRRSSDLLNYFYLNGSKTAPSTGLTSATVAFPMPTTAGPYEFRLWRNCAAILAESQVVTVGTSGGAFSFTVNGSTAALTVAAGATVPLGVQNGPGNPADCVAIYPPALPTRRSSDLLNYFYLNGSKTAPSTGLTSATVAFPMPTTAGPYEFRLWRNCAAILAESQVVTVGTSGGAFSFTVNGSTAALTVAAGATVPLGVQNGPGNPADCVAIYPPALPTRRSSDLLNYFYLNGSKTAPSTGLTSATVAFPMPTTAGPYEFRLWRNCATILAKSQVVTVSGGGAPAVTAVSPMQGTVGASVPVTITGTNLQTGATLSVGAGITVGSVVVSPPSSLTATLTISSSATVGPRDVTVTNLDSTSGILPGGFSVTAAG